MQGKYLLATIVLIPLTFVQARADTHADYTCERGRAFHIDIMESTNTAKLTFKGSRQAIPMLDLKAMRGKQFGGGGWTYNDDNGQISIDDISTDNEKLYRCRRVGS